MSSTVTWLALLLAVAGHGFLWTGAVNRVHGFAGPRWAIKAFTLVALIALVGIPLAIAFYEWRQGQTPFNPFSGADLAGLYTTLCAAIGAATLVTKPWIERSRCDPSVVMKWTDQPRDPVKAIGFKPLRGHFARLLALIPGNEALSLSVDRKLLAIPRLPAELQGLTIAHISDLHMTGRIGREYYDYLVRQVNDLRPDVIAITGDIIENRDCFGWLQPTLGRLCAPLGVYFILGNHDLFVDHSVTRSLLEESGLICLSGRSIKADWNGAAVTLTGNELPWRDLLSTAGSPRPRGADDEFRLMLCHTPDQFRWCCAHEGDLALAGHTHGGQVRLPLLGVVLSPSRFGSRYASGVFRRSSTVLHVTRGIGGETPLRLRCPPELALLELTRSLERSEPISTDR